MKHFFFVFAAALLLLSACGTSSEKRLQEIARCEDSLEQSGFFADPDLAMRLANLYVDYAKKYPQDSIAPIYLYRASDLMSGASCFTGALDCLDRIIDIYPDFSELPICYYMRGNAYENMHKVQEAVDAYNLFLELYPDHPMAESTRQALPYVGMNPEEMLEQILSDASIDNLAE